MKTILLFILITILSISNANAGFTENEWTEISENKTFDKIHGEGNKLFLFEDIKINPFKGSTIVKNTCVGNACTYRTRYLVNNRVFNNFHPQYKNINESDSWITINNIDTRVKYLEKNYTYDDDGILMPNQEVQVRKFYKMPFYYDTTPPTCGEVKLFNDENLTQSFNYNGGWLNTTKYYTMICDDPETGCKCDTGSSTCVNDGGIIRTPALALGYKAKPKANFTNNVSLSNFSCEGTLPNGVSDILYDRKSPKVEIYLSENINYNGNSEGNRTYLSGNGIGKTFYEIKSILNIKASTTNVKFNISDEYLSGSLHGVSGLKSVEIKSYKIKNKNLINISPQELNTYGCSIDENYSEYNSDGSIEISDNRGNNLNLDCSEFQKTGRYKIITNITDWAGNKTKVIAYFNVYPSDLSESKSFITVNSTGDKYANNSDYYRYTLNLRDMYSNPIYNKGVNDIIHNGDKLLLDSTNIDSASALTINSIDTKTNNDGEYDFKLSSYAPGTFVGKFSFDISKWDNTYQDISGNDNIAIGNVENSFKKPIIGKISLEGTEIPEIGKDQKYTINLINTGSLNLYSRGKLNILESTIISTIDGHYWNKFNVIKNNFENDLNTSLYFSGSIDGTDNLLKSPKIKTDNIKISYKLGGKNISYNLDDFEIDGASCDFETLGVKINGTLQGDGKSDITGQKSNFSDLSKGTIRAQIRKNAYILTKNRESTQNQNINNIYFVKNNDQVKYSVIKSSLNENDTIIIKDGNFIIDDDIDTNIGIIVLKDNYDVKSDYNNKGNIYVKRSVSNINAIIYADGALISADDNGNKYNDSVLTNSLTLFGSLFSRNTIGGAVKGATHFTLPGGKATTDYNLAENYDLNYTRKVPKTCDGDDTNDYSFIIKYNPSVQNNPPKGFGK